jgi:pimeloyl-ACP methyl ester carboxylesterase
VLVAKDGTRLRTITTRPSGARGRLPAVLFVQWLSCDSIELPASADDGWTRMLRRIVRESGMVVMRTEKRGVGDSEGGPCSRLDYLTELSDHRDALDHLASSDGVDPARVVVFGASMGANFAPLVAQRRKPAGVMVWGGGARPWFERMIAFERNRRELSGMDGERLDAEMKLVAALLFHYVVEGHAPERVAREHPEISAAWSLLLGTEADAHYGRPFAFHQQAQQQNWAGAWAKVDVPVLALFGEYDWYEDAEGARLIADLVNQRRAGLARYVEVPATDHHFVRFPGAREAQRDQGGTISADPAVEEMLRWLRETASRPASSPGGKG